MEFEGAFFAEGHPTQPVFWRPRGDADMNGSPSTNSYLSGNFAPVRSEDDFDLEVAGEFPSALAGAFYRNGPNPQFEPRGALPLVLRRRDDPRLLRRGRQGRYRNRYVRTPKWQLEHAAGKAAVRRLRHPTTADPSVTGKDSGVANTNIVWHAGRLMALEEAPQALRARSREPRNRAAMSSPTGARSPPTPRSIRRPARWSGSAIRSGLGRSRRPCRTA